MASLDLKQEWGMGGFDQQWEARVAENKKALEAAKYTEENLTKAVLAIDEQVKVLEIQAGMKPAVRSPEYQAMLEKAQGNRHLLFTSTATSTASTIPAATFTATGSTTFTSRVGAITLNTGDTITITDMPSLSAGVVDLTGAFGTTEGTVVADKPKKKGKGGG